MPTSRAPTAGLRSAQALKLGGFLQAQISYTLGVPAALIQGEFAVLTYSSLVIQL